MAIASKMVRAVARAIVDVQHDAEHLFCKEPAYCMARAAIREYKKWLDKYKNKV